MCRLAVPRVGDLRADADLMGPDVPGPHLSLVILGKWLRNSAILPCGQWCWRHA